MRIPRWAIALPVLLFAACDGTLLPSFDGGVLNPEFRHLRAGDVVNGAKCAMVAFMLEREEELLKQRREYPEVFSEIETKINRDDPKQNVYFSIYHKGAKTPQEINCGRGQHWIWPADKKNYAKSCPVRSPGCCVANECNKGALGAPLWDYTEQKGPQPKARGCIPVPDYSRFALDSNQAATITFSLSAINGGFINYARIDATRLDGLYPNLIVQGGGPSANPFPQMLPAMKGTTSLDLAVTMPQSLYASPATMPDVPAHEQVIGVPIEIQNKFAGFRDLTAINPSDVSTINSAINAARELRANKFTTFGIQNLENEWENKLTTSERRRSSLAMQLLVRWRNETLALTKNPLITSESKGLQYDERVQPLVDDLSRLLDLNDASARLMRTLRYPNPKAIKDLTDEIRRTVVNIRDSETRERLEKQRPDLTTTDFLALKYVGEARTIPTQGTSETFTPQALAARADAQIVTAKKGSAIDEPKFKGDPGKDFAALCVGDRYGYQIGEKAYIDYLALKRLLHNVVNEQNGKLHRGGPPVTMETLTLSTSFQMTLEIQAGTVHIFRIVPLLQAPNTEFKADHTHTLKMVLKGVKKKGDPSYSTKLVASCKQRLQDNAVAAQADRCATVEGLLLEAITEALENSSSAQ